MKRIAVIMAGGTGERFWPMSRRHKPKQLLNLNQPDKSLIQESIDRILPVIDMNDIYIITSEVLLSPIRKALPDLPPENVIAEPAKRNTAPCLALAAAIAKSKYEDAGITESNISIAILTADQLIFPNEKFVETVENALSYVEKNQVLATIGINPSRPETGYGYIEIEHKFDENENIQKVLAFREKPSYEKALEYAESGKYLWNSGMFFWRLDTFIEAMTINFPEVGKQISTLSDNYKGFYGLPLETPNMAIKEIFEAFPNQSIDYGLMERAENVVVAKALFDWDDVGSWDSLDRVRKKDENGNVSEGDNLIIECKDSIIVNKVEGREFIIAGLGLEDFVIVANNDSIIICPKNKVQDIKKVVTKLNQDGRDNLL